MKYYHFNTMTVYIVHLQRLYRISFFQLHAVSRISNRRQREPSVKTLRFPLFTAFWRHCVLIVGTQRHAPLLASLISLHHHIFHLHNTRRKHQRKEICLTFKESGLIVEPLTQGMRYGTHLNQLPFLIKATLTLPTHQAYFEYFTRNRIFTNDILTRSNRIYCVEI